MKTKFENTLQKGAFRRIVFKEKDVWYAVALELNLVVSSNDPKVALLDLYDAVTGYLEAVKKSNSRPFALNQTPEDEYQNMWDTITGKTKTSKTLRSPYTVFDFGYSNISA